MPGCRASSCRYPAGGHRLEVRNSSSGVGCEYDSARRGGGNWRKGSITFSPPLDDGRTGFGLEPWRAICVRVTTGLVRVRGWRPICSCEGSQSVAVVVAVGRCAGIATSPYLGDLGDQFGSYGRGLGSHRPISEFMSSVSASLSSRWLRRYALLSSMVSESVPRLRVSTRRKVEGQAREPQR